MLKTTFGGLIFIFIQDQNIFRGLDTFLFHRKLWKKPGKRTNPPRWNDSQCQWRRRGCFLGNFSDTLPFTWYGILVVNGFGFVSLHFDIVRAGRVNALTAHFYEYAYFAAKYFLLLPSNEKVKWGDSRRVCANCSIFPYFFVFSSEQSAEVFMKIYVSFVSDAIVIVTRAQNSS